MRKHYLYNISFTTFFILIEDSNLILQVIRISDGVIVTECKHEGVAKEHGWDTLQ